MVSARSRELVYTCLVLCRYMTINVVLNDRVRLHADRLRGAYEIQDERKKQFSWEKQTQIANEEVENFKQ